MEESQFNKFKEDKFRVLLELEIEELLQPQGETMQLCQEKTEYLDAYDLDCDDISLAKAVLMANLSSCDSDVLSKDMNSSAPNDLLVLSLVEQMTDHVANLDKEIQTNKMEHDVIFVIDDEETLILEEESRSKMLDKQNDPISIKQKINISPTDYLKLNKIKKDFGKRFVTQKELSAEQAFWLKHINYYPNTSVKSHTPVRIEAPSKLPKASLVNESLKKLKSQLASFDKVVKKRTTSDANNYRLRVCFIDKNAFEIEIKQLRIDNDQLLKQFMSQEIVHIAVNYVDILNVNKSCVDECNKCLELETELLKKKDLIEKDVYDKLLKSYSTLEKHCISLELTTQLNQETFPMDNFRENQNAPTFNQLFELNELKAQSKGTVIRKLKERIKSLSGKDSVENVKKDIDEIKTINIKLEHTLKNELRNLKRKNIVDTVVSKPSATIAPRMFKLDIELISHRLKNNKDSHEVYFEKTIENTDTLRGLELLVYVSKTCPSLMKPNEKLFAVTPINKDKKVKFAEPVTSSNNIPKQTESFKTKDCNKPLLTSTRVKPTTSASGSNTSGGGAEEGEGRGDRRVEAAHRGLLGTRTKVRVGHRARAAGWGRERVASEEGGGWECKWLDRLGMWRVGRGL
ncbi:hypothetical protein Tco_1505312 [Tanacetum coccineum]